MTRKVTLNDVDFEAVKVHAVERTESGTDGNPFSWVPPWLVALTEGGQLDFHTVGESDWAHFRLIDHNGSVQIVHPGDVIIHNPEVGAYAILERLAKALLPEAAGT